MDLLKTPSVQSLLDSDVDSVESLQYLDFEELDEVEYALPTSEAPTLAEVLSTEVVESPSEAVDSSTWQKQETEPATCSALQVDFLQAVSQQLAQAQERSSAGVVTTLSVGIEGKLTVGTAHGHLLSFYEQTLRWVCDSNTDRGAVSCLSYNKQSTRLLAGYARGLICQYESIRGLILRRVTLGGEIWGTLRVTWAGASGIALDTGGSVWLMKFSRPLGVRSARTSCLFSGARGEVVAMCARDARILALATLSRVIIVAGGRAAGLRLSGPPDTLPVLEWSETDERILVCARGTSLQWLALNITGSSISLRPVQRVELKASPLWLGWLDGNLAIFGADETLRLWGEDYDKPLDLSEIEPVYASVFFKGVWTEGRVSGAMRWAGAGALGGASAAGGALCVAGRRGVARVRPRPLAERARAAFSAARPQHALRLLCAPAAPPPAATHLARHFVTCLEERPHLLADKPVADHAVKLCLKYNMSEELWSLLWEQCSHVNPFVEALADAVVRGELDDTPPSPDCTQALIERLAEFEPELVERVLACLPLTSLDPHRASVFTREKGLWRAVAAVAAALGGSSGALRELVGYVNSGCGERCTCAGPALVVVAADALAGRGPGGRALPSHARPSARHDALHALLTDEGVGSPLRALVRHSAGGTRRLLEQCARDPPFAGPLGKQNRLRVARALLTEANLLTENEDRVEILEFIAGQLASGALPADSEVIEGVARLAAGAEGERADRAWLALGPRAPPAPAARPRLLWREHAAQLRPADALNTFLQIDPKSNVDVDELFDYLRARVEDDAVKVELRRHLSALVELRPAAVATVAGEHLGESIAPLLRSAVTERMLEFGESLLEAGHLSGDAATAHFRNLCELRPHAAREFLTKNVGIVRPEDALSVVRETGATEAEAICLEATGDPGGALDVLLRMAAATDERSAVRLVGEAGELCGRVAPGAPPALAAAMWARVVRQAGPAAPALLEAAAAYLPAEELVAADGDPRVALALLGAAARRRAAWGGAARVAAAEGHEALARALGAARRGLAVRGGCVRCGAALGAGGPVRTVHCARAAHCACEASPRCPQCGRRVPEAAVLLAARSPRPRSPPPDHNLWLAAPPRPDLEGVV